MVSRNYLLMPWGRVGSNLLLDIFDKSGVFLVENEPLTEIRTQSTNPDYDQKEWLRSSRSRIDSRNRIINLSIRSMIDRRFFLDEFKSETDANFLYLTRRNPIHVILSAIKAEHYAALSRAKFGSERWSTFQGEEIFAPTKVDVGHFSRMLSLLLDDEKILNVFLEETVGHLFYYEDILLSISMVVDEMSWIMGVKPPRLNSRMVKTIQRPYSEEFENYAEVVGVIRRDYPALERYIV